MQPSGRSGPMSAALPVPMPRPMPRPRAIRVSARDRDAVAHILQTAFAEGRLDNDEFDLRLGAALTATFATDLDALIVDLPAAPAIADRPGSAPPIAAKTRTSGLAVASLCCGVAQAGLGAPLAVPAIVLGILALWQIKHPHDAGRWLAIAGLALGIVGVILNVGGFYGLGIG